MGSRNKRGSQTGSSKRRRVQTVTVPGLPCPCGHVTVADACQRETHTPSLRGWGWGVKDGSRLPSPRLFSFSRQGLGHSTVLRTDSQGRKWGEKRKVANSITSRTSHMICRSQCKRKRWGAWFRECSGDQVSISTLNPVWDHPQGGALWVPAVTLTRPQYPYPAVCLQYPGTG